MNGAKLESIIKSEVMREMKRRRFKDADEDVEDEDDVDVEDLDEDMLDGYDMEDDDMMYDEDEDFMDEDDDDDEVKDADEDVEDEDEDDKKASKDSMSALTRQLLRKEINRAIRRKTSHKDSLNSFSKDMQKGYSNKSVMDKRDIDRCNAWKKTIGKEI